MWSTKCLTLSTILAVLPNWIKFFRGNRGRSDKMVEEASGLAVVKDRNGETAGAHVDLRKKMCQEYVIKGSCARGQERCKFWHICKSFIDGNCDGDCKCSFNFLYKVSKKNTKKFNLEKRTNDAIKSVVAWSLPQVYLLYLRIDCKSNKCPYLHICPKAIRESPCK